MYFSVDKPVKKPIIGILGGVASGKSTVAAEFAGLGCAVIDADKIAHELLDNEDIRGKIVSCFGQSFLDAAGRIVRGKLADIVFADAGKLARLNDIIHPLVLAEAERLIEHYSGQAGIKAIVLDMPLLVEVGWHKRCKKLVFVDCQANLRAARAGKMGIFGEEQLIIRENFQIPLDMKMKLADNVVDNNSGASQLARQIAEIFSTVVSGE
jgi:dephospho-CoA kinase